MLDSLNTILYRRALVRVFFYNRLTINVFMRLFSSELPYIAMCVCYLINFNLCWRTGDKGNDAFVGFIGGFLSTGTPKHLKLLVSQSRCHFRCALRFVRLLNEAH